MRHRDGALIGDASGIDFSLVVAIRNPGRHFEAFITSVEAQTYPTDRFETVVVDHGSIDGTLERARAWAAESALAIRVVEVEATGRGEACNAGIDVATGRWISFPEAADQLAPDYLSQIASFIAEEGPASLIVARRLIFDDDGGPVFDTHPLRGRLRHGRRLRKLEHYPDHFHDAVADAFLPLEDLRASGARFEPAVGPTFEEVKLCASYLLEISDPVIGFVPEARYLRRVRSESSANPQHAVAQPELYLRVLRDGMLDLLRRGQVVNPDRHPPEWVQALVLYELSWYFTSRDADAGAVAEAEPTSADIHSVFGAMVNLIAPQTIRGFSARSVSQGWRDVLLHAFSGEPWHSSVGHVARMDPDQGLVKVTYRFTGEQPSEELLSGGAPVPPHHAKVRDIAYFGRVLMYERVVWVSSRQSVGIRVNGIYLDLQFDPPRVVHTLQPGAIKRVMHPKLRSATLAGPQRTLWDRLILRVARTWIVRRYFGGAWVLMDRITDAGDNAERLFRYLRRSRRRINAWFVVEGGSPDWHRLRADGYRRVIPYGSLRWKLLMANCRHLISSHVSPPIVRPPELKRLFEPSWRFTFLQHGVIHTNLSRWLNIKPIDLFVTSSIQEYASIAGDHTPYTFTTKEVRLTGLPRWDRLVSLSEQLNDQERDLVLVAPTWRSGLVPLLMPGSQRRSIDPGFFTSEYAINWMSLLKAKELLRACRDQGLTIGFLPHPNVQPALPGMDLPEEVAALSYADNDVQALFARAAVLVTDYSSVAFDAAYIGRPVVYFQFDHAAFLGGEHHGRRGYFDYARDGFGPVVHSLPDAIETVVRTLRQGRSPAARYRARADATFPLRDAHSCRRVVDEIKRSVKRLSSEEAAVAVETPDASPSPTAL